MRNIFLLKFITVLLISFSLSQFGHSQTGWYSLTSNTTNNLTGVCFVNSSTGFAIGESSTILKTTNEGLNWFVISSPVVATFKDIHFANVNTGYISGLNGVIIKTTDIGQSWSIISTDATDWNAIFIIGTNDTGWVAGTGGIIKKTKNGGTSWGAQTSNTTFRLNGIYCFNGQKGYICGGNDIAQGVVNRTTNGGGQWIPYTIAKVSAFLKIQFSNQLTGWTVGYNPNDSGCISKTTDGGVSWSARTLISSSRINSEYWFTVDSGYVVGNNGAILKSTNVGQNWITETSGTTNNLMDIAYSGNALYAVGNSGKILKKSFYIYSVATGIWSNPSTWSTASVPGQYDNVLIQSGHIITLNDVNRSSNNIIINNSGSLTINQNLTLNIYGNLNNSGTITGTENCSQLQFCGSAAQTFTNSGFVINPLSILTVNNSNGLTIDAASNQITVLTVNLFCGLIANSGKLTIGYCGNGTIQRGASGSSNPAGRFDTSPSFGTGGVNILYISSSAPISTGYEIPPSGNVNYVYIGFNTVMSQDINISDSLNLGAGNLDKNIYLLKLGYNNNTTIYRSNGTLCCPPNFGSYFVNVIYSGTNAITLGNEIPSTTLMNFTNNSSNTVTLNSDITINGNLNLVSGVLNDNGKLISVKGDISGNAVHSSSGSGEILLTGKTSTASISGVTLGNVEFNNANGFILTGSPTISGNLIMTNGNINTNSNILTLGTSTVNCGTLSYTSGKIITDIAGGFRRWFAPATVSNVIFPVGTAGNLNKIILSYTCAPSTGGTLTAKFIPSDPGTNSPNPINDNGYTVDKYSSTGYWQIDNSGITCGTYTIGLEGQGFNIGGYSILNYQLLRLLKRPSSGYDWQALGTHVNGTGSNDDPTASRSGLTEFSQFAYGGNSTDNPFSGPLPVKLTNFTFSVKERDLTLTWTTSNEQNNSGFQVERTISGSNSIWIPLGFVKGKNSSGINNYQFTETKLSSGKYEYRLKQVDNNGNYKYYDLNNTVEIGLPVKYNLSQNYPNPFNPATKFDFALPENSKVKIDLYNVSGKKVLNIINENSLAGYYTKEINGNNLSSGVYFLVMSANSASKEYLLSKKLLLIK